MATDEGVACATRPRGARPQGDGPWGHAPAGTSRALVARAGIPRPSGLSMRNCGRLLVPCHRRHTVSTAGGRLMLRTRPNSFMRPATLWLDSITRVMLSWCLGAICRRDGSDQPHVDPEQRSHPARVCFEDAVPLRRHRRELRRGFDPSPCGRSKSNSCARALAADAATCAGRLHET